MNGFRIALRVLRVDRRTRTSALLTAVGIAVATTLVLLLLGLPYAADARDDRSAWQETNGTAASPSNASLLMTAGSDVSGGDRIARVDVAQTGHGRATPPPGVERLPGPGESLVSPALAERIDGQPGSVLGERFGKVVGQIGPEALRYPDQLVALVGHAPGEMDTAAAPVTGFATGAAYTDGTLQLLAGVGLVVLIVPCLVLVASAARLTASRREQRLSALRLAGATPRQVLSMVVAELSYPAIVGVALGLALGPLARSLAAQVPWDGGTWYAADLATPTGLTVAAAIGLPVLVLGAAALGLRRVVSAPLGAATGQRAKPVHWWRLATVPVAGVAFLGAASQGADTSLVLLALAAMIGSAAVVGPWITAATGRMLVRRWRGPAGLLAGRRLESDPRAAYRASAGVVLAVFVGSMALTLFPTFEARGDGGDGTFPASTLTVRTDSKHAARMLEQTNSTLSRYGQDDNKAVAFGEVMLTDADGMATQAYVGECVDAVQALGVSATACREAPGVYSETKVEGTAVAAAPEAKPVPLAGDLPSYRLPGSSAVLIDPGALPDGVRPPSSVVAVPTSAGDRELVRTALVAAAAGSPVSSGSDYRDADNAQLEDLRRVTVIGIAAAGLLAGCSVAITTAGSVMDRRRTFGALIAAGTPPPMLSRTLRVEAALPAIIATVGAGIAGTVGGVGIFSLAASPSEVVFTPWLLVPAVVGVAVALLAASVCAPALRRVREEPLTDE